MGIQINGNNDIISALDGSWTAEGASINTSGILTATTFKGNIVGTAATFTGPVTIGGTLTYEDVTNIDSVGIITARGDIHVGENIKHIGDTDTKIVFTDNQIDFHAHNSSRLYVNQYAVYVQTGHPLAFLATGGGATPHIKSGGTNNQDLLLTSGSGNPTRICITSGGPIGVGNENPQVQYFNNFVVGNNVSGDKGITIRSNSDSSGILAFSDTDVGDANRYDGYIRYSHIDQHMGFYTGGANERLRITSAGKVGINSTSPTYALEVDGGTQNTVIAVRSSDAKAAISFLDSTSGGYGRATIGGEGDAVYITSGNGIEKIRFGTGGSGNTIGISTTLNLVTNSEALSIRGYSSFKSTAAGYAAIYTHNEGNTSGTYNAHLLWNAGGANRGGIGYMPNTGDVIINNHQDLIFATGGTQFSGTERLRIDASGWCMLNTSTLGSSKTAKELIVSYNNTGISGGDQGRSGITIRSGQNTSSVSQPGYIYFSDGTSGTNESIGSIKYDHNDDNMNFATGGYERLRIDSNGHLSLRNAGNSHQELQWYTGTTKSASIGWGNGSANWEFKHFRGDSQAGAPYANIDFFTGDWSNPTRALRITEDGMLLLGETNDDGMSSYDIGMKNGRVIRHRNAAGNAWINTFGLDSSNNIKIGWGGSPNEIHFGISGIGETLKILSDGNIRWWPDGSSGVNLHATSGTSNIVLAANKDGSVGTAWHFKNQNSSGQAQTWMEIDDNQRMHIPYSSGGTDKLNIYTGADAASKGITITGQDGNNQNSHAGVIRFNGYGQTNGPWIFGKNVLSWGKKDLIFGTKSTTNDYSTELAESMRLTKYGELQLPYGSNGGANINYIEAADFKPKYEGSNWMPSNGDMLRFATRRNSNSSFISLTGSNDDRITFSRACHVLFTMSQDVLGNTDTGYWYINVKVNGSTQSQQLVRKSTQWDQFTFQQHLEIAANGYIELQCYFSNMTGLNIDWSSYSVVAWQH